jgi:hypothetical protein
MLARDDRVCDISTVPDDAWVSPKISVGVKGQAGRIQTPSTSSKQWRCSVATSLTLQGCQCKKDAVAVSTNPIAARITPSPQKNLRPEGNVIEVITSPAFRNTSAKSKRSARFRSVATSPFISLALSSFRFAHPCSVTLHQNTSLALCQAPQHRSGFTDFCSEPEIVRVFHSAYLPCLI